MRKIIQVAALNRTDFEPTCVLVVCNDGTLWEISSGVWERYPDIPQDEVKNDQPN